VGPLDTFSEIPKGISENASSDVLLGGFAPAPPEQVRNGAPPPPALRAGNHASRLMAAPVASTNSGCGSSWGDYTCIRRFHV